MRGSVVGCVRTHRGGRVSQRLPRGLGWFLAVLRLVLGGELVDQLGIAEEALRFRPLVLPAPVALLLAVRGDLRVALTADVLRHAVLDAPVFRPRGGRLDRRFGRFLPFGFLGAASPQPPSTNRPPRPATPTKLIGSTPSSPSSFRYRTCEQLGRNRLGHAARESVSANEYPCRLGPTGPLKTMYSTRSTNRLITMALKTPPMTTLASGRCHFGPHPRIEGHGYKPQAHHSAPSSG